MIRFVAGALCVWAMVCSAAAAIPDEPAFLWRFKADGAVRSVPATDGRWIYVATEDGSIFALDERGSRVWKTSFKRKGAAPARFTAPLVVWDGVVFVHAEEKGGFALDAANGKPIQTDVSFDEASQTARAVKKSEADRVVKSDGEVALMSDAKSGDVIWSKRMNVKITALAITDDMIIVCLSDGSISSWGSPRSAPDSNVDES